MFRARFRVLAGACEMLQQRVNALTGECEWVVIKSMSSEEENEAVVKSLSESLYLDMLNDHTRNKAFYSAIRKLYKHPSSYHVLDIGTGTGLLSMMAARTMRKFNNDSVVTTCESYLPMYKLAQRVLSDNQVESKLIRLLNMRSDEIKLGVDMHSRADILVCEILDSELIGEGVIPSLRHAYDHLLKPNPRAVPYCATLYGQLVECDFLWRCHDLGGVEEHLSDGILLYPNEFSSFYKYCQYAFHVDAIPGIRQLSEPFEAFNVEFYKSPDAHRRLKHNVKITKTGTAHAIVSWWVLQLDEEASIFYSTAPQWIKDPASGGAWCDHWKQCVWFLRGQGVDVKQNTHIDVFANHDETRVWYDLGSKTENVSTVGTNMLPDRTRMLGDKRRRSVIQAAIQKALQAKGGSVNCLVLDDSIVSIVCTLSANENKHLRLFSIFPNLKDDGLKYLSTIKGLKLDNLTLVHKESKQLTMDDLNGKTVDVLIAEPYYRTYEHMLPWKQLRFWYERSTIKHLLSEDAVTSPCEGILYGKAYSLPDLWNSRRSLGKVEGFDHSSVNEVIGACGELPDHVEPPILPFSIWQCGKLKPLTEPFVLLKFNFNREIESLEGSVKVSFKSTGVCHGIVLWMDWVMDPDHTLVLSTGPAAEGEYPSCWKQGVKLLSKPVEAVEMQEFDIQVRFDAYTGDVSVEFFH